MVASFVKAHRLVSPQVSKGIVAPGACSPFNNRVCLDLAQLSEPWYQWIARYGGQVLVQAALELGYRAARQVAHFSRERVEKLRPAEGKGIGANRLNRRVS